MEKNPSLKANTSLAGQEIPRILWDAKFHHRFHKGLSPVSRLFIPLENMLLCYSKQLLAIAQSRRWRTTLCQFSANVFNVFAGTCRRLFYSQTEEAPRVVTKT